MKVSYYSLGNLKIAFKGLFESLGIETIMPPEISKKTMEFATKYAPESSCYPFKVILGQYMDAIESGADTIFFLDSATAFGCRLHQYTEGCKTILDKLGYKADFIGLGGELNKRRLYNELKKANPNLTFPKFIKSLLFWLMKMNAIEQLEDLCAEIRGYETNKGDTTLKLLNPGLKLIDNAKNISQIRKAKKQIKQSAKKILINKDKKTIKILLVGDLYSMLEPYANKNVVETLGDMKVEAIKPYRLSEDLRNPAGLGPWGGRSYKTKWKYAKPYLKREIGAGAFKSIGDCARLINDVDGVIQIYAFACMPEIINQVILDRICKENNKPILHLTVSEHNTLTSFNTKVEAFVDMLQ